MARLPEVFRAAFLPQSCSSLDLLISGRGDPRSRITPTVKDGTMATACTDLSGSSLISPPTVTTARVCTRKRRANTNSDEERAVRYDEHERGDEGCVE